MRCGCGCGEAIYVGSQFVMSAGEPFKPAHLRRARVAAAAREARRA